MFSVKRVSALLITVFVAQLCVVCLSSCKGYSRNKSYAHVPDSSIQKGVVLAQRYCGSCHALPDPSWLDAKTWEKGVLPQMGPKLGIFNHGFEFYPSNIHDRDLDSGFYPSKRLLSQKEWQHIIDYYTATSPDSLPYQQRSRPIKIGLPLFTAHTPSVMYENSMTSFVKLNPKTGMPPLMISDALKKQTFLFDHKLSLIDSITNKGAIVDMEFSQDKILACNIGMLNPTNGKFGKAQWIHTDANNTWKEDTGYLFEGLRRPVQISTADFNNDGREDYLVCEFGYLVGSLFWMENLGGNNYKRHTLKALPGAIKAYVQDYNNDGKLDIWVLFAQGQEGVFLYTNNGNGTFKEEEVLAFPAVYGSSYFELADFNKDGYSDIVYTCGDNADYSAILKPYHGVYVYMNDGRNHFTQRFFFPVNGCYKAMARDYDDDGDLDIAVIAYFADYRRQPEEGFVYLENKGDLDFHPFTLPQAQSGRWLTMDAGDINGDGKVDLVLGNFSMGPTITKSGYDWRKAPPFLLLLNTGKK